MSRVRVYIDGFNVYHAISDLGESKLKWLNHYELAVTFLRQGEVLEEVNFFTAVLFWDAEKQRRHVNYLNALRASSVNVHEANFKKSKKYCRKHDRYCKFHEEKQTDVAISVKIMSDVMSGNVDRVILVTADSDQIPTAKTVVDHPNVTMTVVFPPGRKKAARDLGSIVDSKNRLELTAGRLRACTLPRTVYHPDGTTAATMPALYAV
ncbi:NYN domain-containing protein [Phenylobacterium sp.]|uniref:NYN domain-containing protein n=1 Tax=Phenylobacterium sp. TaxID=1871053 RepID=UPI0025E9E09B|nr:NYN domain-containing protein [Phenylobacterium sp.]MCA3724089.1 NYN domain-containing protein [Phenylobacterium sp.]MCA6230364.1 NYN domain-containing protein [Phenylobacterium sp.]MCA6260355.1 NYN domain-containing protein [Phenylobacterium sp.]